MRFNRLYISKSPQLTFQQVGTSARSVPFNHWVPVQQEAHERANSHVTHLLLVRLMRGQAVKGGGHLSQEGLVVEAGRCYEGL